MIVAAIPVKRLSQAKSRLASRLSNAERSALVLTLLQQTVAALRESGVVGRIAVATPESELGDRLGVESLPDSGSLNSTLLEAAEWAHRAGAKGLLILPGDLPLLRAADVRIMAEIDIERSGIAIAPTHDGGTGALLLFPPEVIPPSFGADSFRRHVELAQARGLSVREIAADAFTFDLDTVENLERFQPYLMPVITAGE
jgi:2-phospho-L-lactate guanylyltransferase